ncbi:class I SAM-dependent methyltransferase [Streptomyces malaysiensis subsp. malaysiensis]|uniref:Class I SAM-dependent methyltransferase n=1 Tax=Streptomyces malaysiensis TaxID=92644 RepID=A0ABX6WG83_STRMQ|nr:MULTISPECIES: class I SAM-dependent methyltransferase [Streptomyces]QPI58946.1 class I SAM-dependent methyltransferase [Streptomyces solisilvae]UHH20583.1 class I SAM-dependent methyltransferase [Streptomyces sp. HNM0561]
MTAKNRRRWNHNIHYHPRILRAIPDGSRRALDVGCGEGMLARALRRTVPHVTAIDLDAPSLDQGRAYRDDIDYILGDFLSHPFEPASFDVIASVATLHHMDAATGLTRMRELLRPGGVLAVVGIARDTLPKDLPRVLAAVAAGKAHRAVKGYWEHPSPIVWPPPVTYPEMRALAAGLLPGSRYRRHLLWRYSVVWHKPRD